MRVETFQTAGPPRVRINLAAGNVRLETGDTTETRVELDGPREDDAVIELRGDEIVVDVDRKRFTGGGRDHRLVVRAPHGTRVDARTASADVEGRGRFGDVEVKSASGDVSFQEVEGRLHVSTASGDVEVGRVAGELRVNSASGDVSIEAADSDARLRTASGDLEIRSSSQGKLELQSASGDVVVGIRRGSKVWIDASSLSGETTSELELSDAPSASDGPLVEVCAKTLSGDITIRQA